MSAPNENYTFLIQKLDAFIRKYYKNLFIKGLIYFLSGVLLSFLVMALLEYYSNFNTLIRSFLFYSYLLLNAFILFFYFIKPLLAYYKLGEIINHKTASLIIGKHFNNVSDKLINTLELHEQYSTSGISRELIEASISQKTKELSPIPFSSAIDLKSNKKYLKYAIIPALILISVAIVAPGMLTESTNRLINYNTYYEKKAPFQFTITNDKLEGQQGEDFELQLKMTGTEIPKDIYLLEGENTYKLTPANIIEFTHKFKNLQKSLTFRFLADGFYSKEYALKVLPHPAITRFNVVLEYPSYLKKEKEKLNNAGDLSVPQGTKIYWTFYAQHTDHLSINYDGKWNQLNKEESNVFSMTQTALKSAFYSLTPVNNLVLSKDTLNYQVQVIPDLFPSISVIKKDDSLSTKTFYFIGRIKDDYGFKRLSFNYKFANKATNNGKLITKELPLNLNVTDDQFFYYWNMNEIGVQAGDAIEYYFEISDNDGVNGSKSTRSETIIFKAPSITEIEKQAEKSSSAFKEDLKEAGKKATQLQKETKKLIEKLGEKETLSFEDKQNIKSLLEKQKELEQKIHEIQKENQMNNTRKSEYQEQSDKIIEKQKQIEELMNNVLDEKTRQMLEELSKLLDESNKNISQEQLEQMQLDNKNLEKELDRILNLYKKLEFEQKLDEKIKQLDELSKKEEQLAEKSKEQKPKAEELKKEQDKVNEDFKDLKKELENLQEKSEELENTEFDNPEKEQDEIQQDLEKSSDELEKNNSKKASSVQKQASDKMKKLSEKLKQMQSAMESEELEIDMKALRELLENLIKVSFDQEKVMQAFNNLSVADPRYLQLTQKQKFLKDDMRMIEDSLYALSKRVSSIKSVVNKEMGLINQNMGKAIESLAERETGEATNRQQYVMTSVNNLAVMLSEALEQMQAQAKAEQKPGEAAGSCKKPGSGPPKKPGLGEMSKMQENLNKQLQQMKDGMKPGQKPGKGQMSEQIAKMAAQQQAIRNALEQLNKEDNKDGQGSMGNLDKLAKEMEKTESDLYNKQLSQETIKRQQEILTRLLEAEKAEREREFDNKRESKEGEQQNIDYNIIFEEYKKLKMKELELIRTVPPSLNPYYRLRVNDYFKLLNPSN